MKFGYFINLPAHVFIFERREAKKMD